MSRLARLVVVAFVFTFAVVPVAEQQPAPAVPVLASYHPSRATGHEWDSLTVGMDAQTRYYSQVAAVLIQQAHDAEQAREQASRPVQAHTVRLVPSQGGSHKGYATARDCVANTENGGDYDQGTNPTHRGRYQFGRPAWIGFGGIAAHWDDWSLATPAEQDQVFDTAWSQGLTVQEQQWLRWDGC